MALGDEELTKGQAIKPKYLCDPQEHQSIEIIIVIIYITANIVVTRTYRIRGKYTMQHDSVFERDGI